jgi:hypothetical protein
MFCNDGMRPWRLFAWCSNQAFLSLQAVSRFLPVFYSFPVFSGVSYFLPLDLQGRFRNFVLLSVLQTQGSIGWLLFEVSCTPNLPLLFPPFSIALGFLPRASPLL